MLDTTSRRPIDTHTTLRDADQHTPETTVLDEQQLRHALADEADWRLRDGALVRELLMRDFDEALRLLERVASSAIDYGRRPDICISEFNHLRLSISNPHHAGLTPAELRLAAKVSAILDAHIAERTPRP